jgi:DUF4097 and DUF4098 domain-containing protein YvlB
MNMTAPRILTLILSLWIGSTLADTPIQLHHDASPTARITIGNVSGTVTVTAWDRNDVQVGGTLGDGARPLAIEGDREHLVIKVQAEHGGWFHWAGNRDMRPSALDVHVPRAASLEVSVVSAPLVIDSLAGGDITVESVSGRARINAQTPKLKVDSVSGNIELAGHADQASLQTVSGDMLAPTLGGDTALQTVSGRIQAHGGPWHRLSVSTVSGDVQINGALAPNGKIEIDSMSGNVQLQLPQQSSATLHASTFSGDLRSDFGTPARQPHGPGSSLEVRLGDGRGRISIETFSGDLRIRGHD